MTSAAALKRTDVTPTPANDPAVTFELAESFGLDRAEYDMMLEICGRTPSYTELGIFSVMWSEHCSYKSSRLHLKKLPTSAPWVIQGPGENAGVIDIGDDLAAVFKIESHNHPSFIEPYQGAATGVGGILRDIFTMGARPIALLNALRFGDPKNPITRRLVSGVVAGIGGYGNCMGIPTVGGETNFHASYNGNILVNAMTVGVARHDAIYYARGGKPGMPIVYVGSKTGRDGIHGATMASAEFDDDSAANRPTVQIGDPFAEKLLLEACLELMAQDAIVSIQDMGAAGLTSSSVEIAAKGEIGVRLDLDAVPQREDMMVPYEIMLSESQERMLMILKPGSEKIAEDIFRKWDLDVAVIGETTDTQRLQIDMYGARWCDLPVPPLVDASPVYDRPHVPTTLPLPLPPGPWHDAPDLGAALDKLLACPDIASKRWIWEQYDSLVGSQTLASPGIAETQAGRAADAALVRVPDANGKTLAITTDCTPRYVQADPYNGGAQAVAETYRNICATGALPLAVTNNLNFGNPQKPPIMGQIVGAIEGIAAACSALDYPVISGNVSLYNETNGTAILPTPVIGGVGVLDDYRDALTMGVTHDGETLLLIGAEGAHLGQSLYVRECFGKEEGPAPEVDFAAERRTGTLVRALASAQSVSCCHDIADGGLLVAIAEMLMAGNGIGADLSQLADKDSGFWFGEDQARYIVATHDPETVKTMAAEAGVPVTVLGRTFGTDLIVPGKKIAVKDLIARNEAWLPAYMNGEEI
jgi:phosphoribosylformylglycinamidine synthase II